ncbi:MAG TPA: ABC transporter substrate-binding protein [Chloroflexota bacterium]|nr:ABC transporter substrate-binding protein [Chloroflexota bacterium]
MVKVALVTVLVATWLMQSCSSEPDAVPSDLPNGCVSPAAAPRSGRPTVRVGVTGALGEAAQYLAEAEGYFDRQGLSVQLINFSVPTRMIPALAAGQLDVGSGNIGPGLFNANENQLCIKVVGSTARHEPDANGVFLFARKELLDSGRLNSYADLKGFRVGLSARDSSNEYALDKELGAGGLTLHDVQLVQMSYPSMLVSLANRSIDVAMMPESLASSAADRGLDVKWKPVAEVLPGVQFGVVLYSPRFAAQHDVAVRWMKAYIQAARDYDEAFFHDVHRAEIVDLLSKASPMNDKHLYDQMSYPLIDPNGAVNVDSVADQMSWFIHAGELKQPADLSQVLDASYAQEAVDQLGAYTWSSGQAAALANPSAAPSAQ